MSPSRLPPSPAPSPPTVSSSEISTSPPENLASKTLSLFDELYSQGELYYTPTIPEILTVDDFTFQFRITPALLPKPFSAHAFAEASPSPQTRIPTPPPCVSPPLKPAPKNPFLPPNPAEIVAYWGPQHTLIVNKFCILRPQLLLLTNTFEPQCEALRAVDIERAWEVLVAYEESSTKGERLIAGYNCGLNAGCSQAHRHVQFVPRPAVGGVGDADGEVFRVFPDRIVENVGMEGRVPFCYYLTRMEKGAMGEKVVEAYDALMERMRRDTEWGSGWDGEAHNLVFTREWVMVIPRRKGEVKGVSTNAFGMVGMVWVKDQEERDRWTQAKMGEVLREMGVSVKG